MYARTRGYLNPLLFPHSVPCRMVRGHAQKAGYGRESSSHTLYFRLCSDHARSTHNIVVIVERFTPASMQTSAAGTAPRAARRHRCSRGWVREWCQQLMPFVQHTVCGHDTRLQCAVLSLAHPKVAPLRLVPHGHAGRGGPPQCFSL